MIAIFKKELHSFFNAPIGYLVILLFLLLNGLFLWVFRGEFNVFDYGFADLSNFFMLLPWVFLFLVPAISMRSLAEERKLGTLELLLIKPISATNIIFGKFLGVFMVGLIALIPTIIYVFAISDLGIITANYDMGLVIGSYAGVLLLLALYASIGIFSSSLSDNQIFAFIIGATLCFAVFYGAEALSTIFTDGTNQQFIKNLGAKAHFEDISRGVLDSRDVIYFLTSTAFFLFLAVTRMSNQNSAR